jgi:hypothetical protein
MNRNHITVIIIWIVATALALQVSGSLAQSDSQPAAERETSKSDRIIAGDPYARLPVYPDQSDDLSALMPMAEEVLNTSQFGYVLKTGQPFTWHDTNPGIRVVFPSEWGCDEFNNCSYRIVDDDFSDPIQIGFAFPFFEKSYTQFYVSTNGLITFDEGDISYRNIDVPHNSIPNNFITPFWEDLDVNYPDYGGQVRYRFFNTSPRRFAVIEFRNVNRHNVENPPLLTFQVVLYEDGDIHFNYKDISGTVDRLTAGIEDGDGRDGLRYLYRQPGLTANSTVIFERPKAPAARVKTLPARDGAFVVNSTAQFNLRVVNTGSLGTDRYNIQTASSSPQWQIAVYRPGSGIPLSDTNNDGIIDTGPIPQGGLADLRVQVKAPSGSPVGSFSEITVSARSVLNPSVVQSTKLQTAVPAPFAQAFTDEEAGFRLGLFSKAAALYPRMEADRWFTGSTLAVATTHDEKFFYTWEMSGSSDSAFFYWTDLEFIRVDRFGNPGGSYYKLTSNENAARITVDRFPALGVTPDGYIGALFVREVLNENFNPNSNIFLSILNPGANAPATTINITQNALFRGEGTIPAPMFATPRLAATDDGKFILAWAARTLAGGGDNPLETSDIWYAVYSKTGAQVKAPAKLTSSSPTTNYYLSPTLVAVEGAKAMLAYHVLSIQNSSYSLIYSALNSNGIVISSPVPPAPGGGWGMDGVQLAGGEILLSWTHSSGEKISYGLLEENNGQLTMKGPFSYAAPDGRPSDYLSVSKDTSGHGILTWMDSAWNNHLYYLMVNRDGTVKTPVMTFYSSASVNIPIITSSTGQGIAYYEGSYITYVPVVRRGR